VVDDGGVALADAGGLDDDQVGAPGLGGSDDVVGAFGDDGAGGRVASDRKYTVWGSIEFIRIRSPSSAPPPLRRVGSMAMTAIWSLSSWSSRKRRTSSSVSEDLPEPPVPVMPSTGHGAAGGCRP
jgi:hypothetical protein